MNGSWQKWALGIAAGIILGGAFAGFVGKAYTDAVEARMIERLEKVETDQDRAIFSDLELIKQLTRVETLVEGIREDVAELKEAAR